MNTKKIFCLLLAVLMLLSLLSGCELDFGNDDYQGGTVTPNSTPASSSPSNADGDETLSLGRIQGGVYTNSYMGISCTLSSKWSFYTAEELQDMPDNVGDAMSGSELGDAIANYDTLFDMMAENLDDLTVINVVYTKLSAAERVAYAGMTEEQIVDGILDMKDALIQSYAQAGITVHELKKVSVTFMGEQHTATHMVAEVSGVAYYTLQFAYQKLGSYGVTLTLGSYVEDRTDDLMLLFAKA